MSSLDLIRNSKRLYYQAGELILEEGDTAPGLLLIRRGEVVLTRDFFGQPIEIAVRRRGQFLAEVAYLDGGPVTTNCRATSDVECYLLDSQAFQLWVTADTRNLSWFCRFVAHRIRSVEDSLIERVSLLDFEKSRVEIRAAKRLENRTSQLTNQNQELQQLVLRDPLTNCLNRRALESTLSEWCKAKNQPFALLIYDLDHFKQINDSFGHKVGDETLQYVTSTLRAKLRDGDIQARYGGEEFVVLFRGAVLANINRALERLRGTLENLSLDGRKITLSGGVSLFPAEALEPADLLELADRRLYDAKAAGRDRIFAPSEVV